VRYACSGFTPCNVGGGPLASVRLIVLEDLMKRALIVAGIVTLIAAVEVGVSRAEEHVQQPQAAQQAAPAANADKAVETTGGCMPDGSCCGHGACAQAAKSSEKGSTGDAAGDATGEGAGGCPCMKNKKAR